jgi:predicted nucleotidyltransferase
MKPFKNLRSFRIRGSDKNIKSYIQDLCAQIVRLANPRRIILFGSYAYGKPTADSDVDLLVVASFEGHPWDQAAKLRAQLQTPMPVDLLVRTPEYVRERIKMGDFFMKEITTKGKVIYEADHAGMDRQSRRGLVKRAA